MNTYTVLFLVALAAACGMRLWLNARQGRALHKHRNHIPGPFQGLMDPQSYRRGTDYRLARLRLSRWEQATGALLLLAWTLGGGLDTLLTAWQQAPAPPLVAGAGALLSVLVISGLLVLPFRILRTFGVEQRYGFSRTGVGLFVSDQLKGLGITAALGLPMALSVLWLMAAGGTYWWIWAWVLWMAAVTLVSGVFAMSLARFFNTFRPLADETLRARLHHLLARHGYDHAEVHEMDGSRRSNQANAFFTGFGRARRVVLFDTLLARLSAEEIEAVIAHELGHDRLRHIQRGLAWHGLGSLLGLAILAWLAEQPGFYAGLGISEPSNAAALALFLLASPVFAFWLQPLMAGMSRRFEREADDFAARETNAGALRSALLKLYRHNAGSLVCDPWYAAFFESHPTPAERIARLSAPEQESAAKG